MGDYTGNLKVDDRIVWYSDTGPEHGMIKWLGVLPDAPKGQFTAGVEFNNPIGTGTGKYCNKQLFRAKYKHASLVPIAGLIKEEDSFSDEEDFKAAAGHPTEYTTSILGAEAIYSDSNTFANRGRNEADGFIKSSSLTPVSNQSHDFEIGTMVEVNGNPKRYGIIKWIGTLQKLQSMKPSKKCAGLEMEDEHPSFNDGKFGGIQYFDCPDKRGLFVYIRTLRQDSRFQEHPRYLERTILSKGSAVKMATSQPVLNVKAVEEELQCAICLERFNNPLSLPCSHTFCHDCLDDHIKHRTDRGQFLCPTCREPTKAQPNGANGFQRNFMASNLVEILAAQENTNKACGVCDDGTKAVHMCIDCHEYHCQVHARDHHKQKATKSHFVVSLEDVQTGKYENEIRAHQVVHCAKHLEEKVRYYCTECKIPVCIDCVNTGECSHTPAQRQNLTAASEQVKAKLKECAMKLQAKIAEKENVRKTVQQSERKAATSLNDTGKKIKKWYQNLCKTLKTSKEKYITSLRQKAKGKSQAFTTFQTNTEKDLKQLKQAEQQTMMVYNYGNPAEILRSHHAILQQQEKLETEIPNRDVPAVFTTTFVGNQSFRELLQKPEQVLGEVHHTAQLLKVFDTKLPDDTGDPLIFDLVVHKTSDISATDNSNNKLKTFSTNGKLMDVFTGDQDCNIVDPTGLKLLPTADMLMGNFSEKNVVVISPERKVKKVYPVDRKVVGVVMNGGQLITTDQNEAPSLTIWDPESNSVILEVNKERGENLFMFPNHIEINSKGHMIVTDKGKDFLYIIDQTGTILFWYNPTADKTKLTTPCGVCLDEQDSIYVSDRGNNRIIQLTPNGQFSCVVVTPEDGLEEPEALTLDNQGNLVVSEQTSGKIKVFQFKLM